MMNNKKRNICELIYNKKDLLTKFTNNFKLKHVKNDEKEIDILEINYIKEEKEDVIIKLSRPYNNIVPILGDLLELYLSTKTQYINKNNEYNKMLLLKNKIINLLYQDKSLDKNFLKQIETKEIESKILNEKLNDLKNLLLFFEEIIKEELIIRNKNICDWEELFIYEEFTKI